MDERVQAILIKLDQSYGSDTVHIYVSRLNGNVGDIADRVILAIISPVECHSPVVGWKKTANVNTA